jgi:hypothetical protein
VRLPHLAAGGRYVIDAPGHYIDPASGSVLVRFVNDQPDASFYFQFVVAITGHVE